jgi:Domain of unknown function (DUF4920)
MRGALALLLSTCLPMLAETRLGKPLTIDKPLPVNVLMEDPARHSGKIVQVRGQVTEVCERMGCWMNLVDPASGKRVRVKVNDGDIVFPKTAIGKTAVAEGKLAKLEFTREQAVAAARHEAEEQGRKFDPATIKSGSTIYQIQGEGAVILD